MSSRFIGMTFLFLFLENLYPRFHHLNFTVRMKETFTISNHISEMPTVFENFDVLAKKCRLDSINCNEIQLVLEEIISNIIYYSYPETVDSQIEVDIELKSDILAIKVTDYGMFFNPLQMPDPSSESSSTDLRIGGKGIELVKKLMDSIVYKRIENKNIILIKKRIKYAEDR